MQWPELMHLALTHPSYGYERNHSRDYERLEFLGDAVLELLVSDYIYHDPKSFPEGDMTKLRASMVREESLAQLARDMKLGSYLFLGHGEEQGGGHDKDSNLSDAFEAVLAAIYLNLGLMAAAAWLAPRLAKLSRQAMAGELVDDYKSRLLEYFQSRHDVEGVSFEVFQTGGPAHKPLFKARVIYRGTELAVGEAGSKKRAEQLAASEALAKIKKMEMS